MQIMIELKLHAGKVLGRLLLCLPNLLICTAVLIEVAHLLLR